MGVPAPLRRGSARLARHLNLDNVTLVGASRCAIIWSYFELFGSRKVKAAVFVDQAPLQNRAEDWAFGSKGCYDAVSLTRLQALLKYDFMAFTKGNVDGCLSNPVDPGYARLLMAETMKADPVGLATLMADHTQLDWRPALRRIDVPCLVLAGGKSQIFPLEGVKEVGRPSRRARWCSSTGPLAVHRGLPAILQPGERLRRQRVAHRRERPVAAALGGRGPFDRVRAQRARVPGVEQGEPGGERHVAVSREAARSGGDGDAFYRYIKYFFRLSLENDGTTAHR